MSRWSSALLLACALTGCGGVTVRTDAPAGAPETFKVERYLWGLIGGEVDVGPVAIACVEVDDTLLDKLVTWVSGGLYCPMTAKVWFTNAR
jgi:hypothetical protein